MRHLRKLRKELNTVICLGPHPSGVVRIESFYTQPQVVNAGEIEWERIPKKDRLFNAHVWSCRLRRDYIFGDIANIKKELEKHGPRMRALIPGEVAYLEALLFYHDSSYTRCRNLLLSALKQSPDCYLLVRLHLVLAKCAYRYDDFPSALNHLEWSCYYIDIHHQELEEEERYEDYLRARIQTVAIRLLVDRRGRSHDAWSNVSKAREYLVSARKYLQEKCQVNNYDSVNKTGGHPFLAEIYELWALVCRSKGHITVGSKFGLAKKYMNSSDKCIWNMIHMLKGIFPKENTRRQAHAYRMLGYNRIVRLLFYRRWNQEGYERKKWLSEAKEYFQKEIVIRKKAGLKQVHATLARAHNHLAFVELLFGHGALSDNPDRDANSCLEEAKVYFDQARNSLDLALKANNYHGGVKDLKNLTLGKVGCLISKTEFFHTVNHYMETVLRATGEINDSNAERLFAEMWHLTKVISEVEWQISQERHYREAKEDISRRTRPIYEIMLEVCFLVKEHLPRTDSRWQSAVLYVFEIAIGTGLIDIDKKDPVKTSKVSSGAHKSISSITESSSTEMPLPTEVIPSGAFQIKPDENRPIPIVSFENLVKKFTGNPGSISVYFAGKRHLYALHLAGGKRKAVRGIELRRLTTNPYIDVADIRGLLVKHLRLVSAAKEPGNILGATISSGQTRNELLHLLWQKLVAPLNLKRPEDGVSRHYIIPDHWLWKVHWAALITSRVSEGEPISYLFQENVSQHAALLLWNRLVNGQDLTPEEKVTLEHEMLALFLHSVAPDAPRVTNTSTLAQANMSINDEIRKVTHSALEVDYDVLNEVWGDCEQFFDQTTEKRSIMAMMEKANLIVINAHRVTEDGSYLVGVSLNDMEECQIILTQDDIEELDLHRCRLVMLMCCNGGDGPTRTGQLPLSLSSAFLMAKAQSIVYCNEELHYLVAKEYAKAFLKASLSRSSSPMINCHRVGLQAVLDLNDSMQYLSDPAQWGAIHFLGDQQLRLFDPSFCIGDEA